MRERTSQRDMEVMIEMRERAGDRERPREKERERERERERKREREREAEQLFSNPRGNHVIVSRSYFSSIKGLR